MNISSLAARVSRLEEAAGIDREPLTVVVNYSAGAGNAVEGIKCLGKRYPLQPGETLEELENRVELEARKSVGGALLVMSLYRIGGFSTFGRSIDG